MDPKRKFFLLKKSENFCAAPWTNLFLGPTGDILTCCAGRTVLGNIRTHSLVDILRGDTISKIKTELIQDKPHENCVTCYQFSNGSDAWIRGTYNDLNKNTDVDFDDINLFKLTTIDVRWSNTCNLKCVYCHPAYSSSIEKESNIIISNGDTGNDQVLDFILKNQESVVEIYLAGGEPLLTKENREFLKNWTNLNTALRISTNLSNIHEKNSIFSLTKKFKNIIWGVSIDNTTERFEYTRYGSNWQQFLTNLETIKLLNQPIRFNMVYFVGNALTIDDDITLLHSLVPNSNFNIVPVLENDSLSVANLPSHLKNMAISKLENVQKTFANNTDLCNNIISCINELNQPPNRLDYKEYFNNLDSKRNTDWKQVFPELI